MKLRYLVIPIVVTLAFPTASLAAPGQCTPGAGDSAVFTDDGRALSILAIDGFVVTSAVNPTDCAIGIPVPLNSGFGVYELNYGGFALLGPDQNVRLLDTDNGDVVIGRIDGEFEDQFVLENARVGTVPGGSLDLALQLAGYGLTDEAMGLIETIDGTLIGFAELDDLERSFDEVAMQRAVAVTYSSANADLLLGFLEPFDRGTGASSVAAYGSYLAGANASLDFSNGFSAVGGAASSGFNASGAEVSSLLVTGAVRYALPEGTVRPFAEAGFWAAPNTLIEARRTYTNLDTEVTAESQASGMQTGVFGTAGFIYSEAAGNELVFSATLARNWSDLGSTAETSSVENLFAANFDPASTAGASAKLGAAWSSAVSEQIDVTVSAALGYSVQPPATVSGSVDWVGAVEGSAADYWYAQYGARVGWQVNDEIKAGAFVMATSGPAIGLHAQVGGSLNVAF